jgi:uncharacterized protein (DUF2267 family)
MRVIIMRPPPPPFGHLPQIPLRGIWGRNYVKPIISQYSYGRRFSSNLLSGSRKGLTRMTQMGRMFLCCTMTPKGSHDYRCRAFRKFNPEGVIEAVRTMTSLRDWDIASCFSIIFSSLRDLRARLNANDANRANGFVRHNDPAGVIEAVRTMTSLRDWDIASCFSIIFSSLRDLRARLNANDANVFLLKDDPEGVK